MGFQSKTYSLSDEVVEAIERLRKQYGSPNKAFQVVLVNNRCDQYCGFCGEPIRHACNQSNLRNLEISSDKKENVDKQVDVGGSFGIYPGTNRHLDAVGPKLSDGVGKISDSVVKDLSYEPDESS